VSSRSESATAVASAPSPRVHSHRVIFIDLARALAVLFMLYGHVVDALLAPEYRQGAWFDVWTFQRGLTSSLFLLLSGFAFSIATVRHWSSHLTISGPVLKRARRFGLLILLGYAMHIPVTSVRHLPWLPDPQWRSFLAVDVLQLIGATLLLVQLLVLMLRTRQMLAVAALALAAAIAVVTPALWLVDLPAHMPLWLSSYLEQDTGSLFPLFPWSAYILIGVGVGQIYSRWGASNLPAFAYLVLLGGGGGMIVAGRLLQPEAAALFGGGPFTFIPPQVLVRAGTCLVIMGAIAHGSRLLGSLPRIFGAVAQETLLIYFLHLCIVYGSIWGPGLRQLYGPTLGPLGIGTVVVVLIAAMTAVAWQWNWTKHASPQRARRISMVVLGAMALWLI
jgi:uncharacterized membrane protein